MVVWGVKDNEQDSILVVAPSEEDNDVVVMVEYFFLVIFLNDPAVLVAVKVEKFSFCGIEEEWYLLAKINAGFFRFISVNVFIVIRLLERSSLVLFCGISLAHSFRKSL